MMNEFEKKVIVLSVARMMTDELASNLAIKLELPGGYREFRQLLATHIIRNSDLFRKDENGNVYLERADKTTLITKEFLAGEEMQHAINCQSAVIELGGKI